MERFKTDGESTAPDSHVLIRQSPLTSRQRNASIPCQYEATTVQRQTRIFLTNPFRDWRICPVHLPGGELRGTGLTGPRCGCEPWP